MVVAVGGGGVIFREGLGGGNGERQTRWHQRHLAGISRAAISTPYCLIEALDEKIEAAAWTRAALAGRNLPQPECDVKHR